MKKFLAILSMCLFSLACDVETDTADNQLNPVIDEHSVDVGNVTFLDAHLDGEFHGAVVNDSVDIMDGYSSETDSRVILIVEDEKRAYMGGLTFNVGLTDELLLSGETLVSEFGQLDSLVDVGIACSGPAPYQWDQDTPAEIVIVRADTNEDGLVELNFTLLLDNLEHVSGKLEYQIN